MRSKVKVMVCSKVRFKDKKQALRAAHLRLSSNDNTPDYLRVYACEACAGWHLTSKRPFYERHSLVTN